MSKFNKQSGGTKTVNLAGGEAFQQTPKLELASILLTSFASDQFYKTAGETFGRIRGLLQDKKIHEFAAKAAIYARVKFGMRSVTHAMAAELAKVCKGEQWTKHFYNAVIHRPDDATEIMSYYMTNFGNPIPNSLKKGLGMAISRFNEYSLSKYRGDGKAMKMVDIANLVHPKHNDTIAKLIKGELKSTETWEAKLSEAGKTAKDSDELGELKSGVWAELLKENKLGYFALLRNLWNIHTQAPDVLDLALEKLQDEKAIAKSLVLPFRFMTAIEELSKRDIPNKIIRGLSIALDLSVKNVPVFSGKTLVALDCSGSMEGRPVGALFAAILYKSNDADFMVFSDSAKMVTPNPTDSTSTVASTVRFSSGGTNFHDIFAKANKKYDRVVILSDMQAWMGRDTPHKEFHEYRIRTGADPFVYCWDLAGNGTMQFPERNVFQLVGFSEKVFDLMSVMETDKGRLIGEIEKIQFSV